MLIVAIVLSALLGFALGAWQSQNYWRRQGRDAAFNEIYEMAIEAAQKKQAA